MLLSEIFPKETIVVNLSSTEKDELFEELIEVIHAHFSNFDKNEALKCLNERESKMTTGIMHSVGIPHALISSMKGTIGAIGISREGIDYDSLDKAPVHAVFMLIASEDETEQHIQVLKQLATVLQLPSFVDNIVACKSSSELHAYLRSSEESLDS